MVLQCPRCKVHARYVRGDFFGKWVVCVRCETPFAWREADDEQNGDTEQSGMRIQGAGAMKEKSW